ncbi:hypothetical protein SEA_SUCHA_25 [Microbacterium phage Sucha]|nr:hypothetical protein SEA_SUCHA_25 [Microbacterium phage Sucha]
MTGRIKVVSHWERFKRLLVWHPINTDPTDDDRWSVRVWYPLYDLLAIIGGYIAYFIGSPLLNRLFPAWVVDGAAVAFGFAGAITLVGVVVPRLWRVEALGKIGMSFLLTSYAFLVLAFPSRDAQNNSFITVILIMATWGVYPRLTKLFIRGYREARARREAREAKK